MHIFAALKINADRYDRKSRNLTELLSVRRKSRVLRRLYFNKESAREYWLRKGPKQVRLMKMLVEALSWQNTRRGYFYEWMRDQ